MTNLIQLSDSYKFSHFNQYPKGTEKVHLYLAPRGGEYEEVVFHGLPYILQKYLVLPFLSSIPMKDIICDIKMMAAAHGIPFNHEGWEDILKLGYLPIEIKALPEGSIVGNKRPMLTIENTDPSCAWLPGYLETLVLKLWYPCSVATKSLAVRRILERHHEKTSDNISGVDFSYHNFGDRGSTSVEAAAIGGVAHLTQFKGTDNFNALDHAQTYYGDKYQGFSIPASEHSTVTSWGREKESAFYENYLETYKDSPIIACVMDSYDIYKAVDFITSGTMKEKIESPDYPIWVIRPDSGNPLEVLPKLLEILEANNVSRTVNNKGFKVLDKYRFIWGDGISLSVIDEILHAMEKWGYAATNFAFGSGGDIMQNVNRDTCKFAMKCSAIQIDGEWRDVYKDPITDSGKASIRGRVIDPEMKTVFKNGETYA